MAPPGNQAETENTNIDLQRWEKLIYSTLPGENRQPQLSGEGTAELPERKKEMMGLRGDMNHGSSDGRLAIHLPLANGMKNYGTLYLEKDIARDPLKPFTLRRVEHLRRSLVAVLKRLDEKTVTAAGK